MKIMPHEKTAPEPAAKPKPARRPALPKLGISIEQVRYLTESRCWSGSMIADHLGANIRSVDEVRAKHGIARPADIRSTGVNREALWFLLGYVKASRASKNLGCAIEAAQDNARKLRKLSPERRALTFQFDADRRRLYGPNLEHTQ